MAVKLKEEVKALPPTMECVTLTRFFYSAVDRPAQVLEGQLEAARVILQKTITVPLARHQWQALLCLVSDLEAGLSEDPKRTKFEDSFLLIAVNKGMFSVAGGEFHQFCYHHGKLDPRVWQKRRAEQILFREGRLIF